MNGDLGFTQIPNELLTALAHAQMQGNITSRERAVIDFIIRNTYGYHKDYNNLKTSFIAKELGTSTYGISHLLKRLQNKNIIIKDGDEILLNKHYNEWKDIKLPNNFIKKPAETLQIVATPDIANSCNIANSDNIANSCNKTLQIVTTPIANSCNIDTEQKQSETNGNDCLNKTIKYNIKKEERNIKERKIIIKNPFLNEKDFKEKISHAPAKISFNNKTFKFENIPKEKLGKWKEAFPLLNVEVELKKMEAWLAANPNKRKKNYEKFIVNWLSRGGKDGKSRQGFSRYVPISAGSYKEEGLDANAGEW